MNNEIPSDESAMDDTPSDVIQLDRAERLVDAEITAMENLNREADQRYWLRWLAVAVVISLMAVMGVIIFGSNQLLAPDRFAMPVINVIALFIVPIVSITSLAIALLIAAFRSKPPDNGRADAIPDDILGIDSIDD